jgi:hypothetical protein
MHVPQAEAQWHSVGHSWLMGLNLFVEAFLASFGRSNCKRAAQNG